MNITNFLRVWFPCLNFIFKNAPNYRTYSRSHENSHIIDVEITRSHKRWAQNWNSYQNMKNDEKLSDC